MARRHWLDPLARRLLIATGQIPAASALAARAAAVEVAARQADHEAAVERELQELKRARSVGLIDVNRATVSDWRQLPGCTVEQADLLVRLQAGGVQLSGPDDLRRLLQLEGRTLEAWLPRLVFHWYGEPAPLALAPVAINRAGAAELRERLDLCSQRLSRLQRERLRAPFRDLADLQERLGLPAAVVEAWIGRVSFEALDVLPAGPAEGPPPSRREQAASPGPSAGPTAGPSLPPTRRRSPSLPGPGRRP
jgi:DNA uptake protein ComE-like DNA-binding protein